MLETLQASTSFTETTICLLPEYACLDAQREIYEPMTIVADAFQEVFEDAYLRNCYESRDVALAFIRRYAVTAAGLGNTEARTAYFEAQRRPRNILALLTIEC
jgi:hypothetical protein